MIHLKHQVSNENEESWYKFLTAKLLKQGYRYHKLRKTFSKFYHRHSESIVKYNVGFESSSATGHI